MKYIIISLLSIILISGCTSQWSIENDLGTKYGIYAMDSDGSNIRQIYGSENSISNAIASPDGSKIVFYEQEGGIQSGLANIDTSEIALINSDGSGYIKLTDNDWMDFQPRWSPTGTEILFISTGGKKAGTDIYIMDKFGYNQKRLTFQSSGCTSPDWSP